MKNSISEREALILRHLELCSGTPYAEVSKATGMKEHTVRYLLEGLKKRGLVIQQKTFINFYALGLQDFTFFFTFSRTKNLTTIEMIKRLQKCEQVYWLAVLGGRFQCSAAFFMKSAHDAQSAMRSLASAQGLHVEEKVLSMRTAFHALGRKYLGAGPSSHLAFKVTNDAVSIDEIDWNILQLLAHASFESQREVARQLKIPHATLSRRIEVLEEKKIIQGYYYLLNQRYLGVQEYRLLISVRDLDADISAKLLALAVKIPQAIYFIECIGSWDCEIGVEVTQPNALLEVIDKIYAVSPQKILRVEAVEIFTHLKTT